MNRAAAPRATLVTRTVVRYWKGAESHSAAPVNLAAHVSNRVDVGRGGGGCSKRWPAVKGASQNAKSDSPFVLP